MTHVRKLSDNFNTNGEKIDQLEKKMEAEFLEMFSKGAATQQFKLPQQSAEVDRNLAFQQLRLLGKKTAQTRSLSHEKNDSGAKEAEMEAKMISYFQSLNKK